MKLSLLLVNSNHHDEKISNCNSGASSAAIALFLWQTWPGNSRTIPSLSFPFSHWFVLPRLRFSKSFTWPDPWWSSWRPFAQPLTHCGHFGFCIWNWPLPDSSFQAQTLPFPLHLSVVQQNIAHSGVVLLDCTEFTLGTFSSSCPIAGRGFIIFAAN